MTTDPKALIERLLIDNEDCRTGARVRKAYETLCHERHLAAQALRGLTAENERQKTDTGRLLWRDDVEGVCPNVEDCFAYGETVRCGPCAIKAAICASVEPNYSLPALPEVSRLKREVARLKALGDGLARALRRRTAKPSLVPELAAWEKNSDQ